MKTVCTRLVMLVLLAMAGCVSDTARPEIMPGMLEDVAQSSVRNVLASPTFRRYVVGFRVSHGGRNPVVKVGRIRSDSPIVDTEMLKDGLVRPFLENVAAADTLEISADEGLLRTKSAEPPETCARRRDDPRAADIVLSLDVKSREAKRGNGIMEEFKFELSLDDLRDGKRVWKYSVAKGYVVAKGVF